MIIVNKTREVVLAKEAIVVDTIFSRVKGLLGKKDFKPEQALIIKPGKCIHTFFMRFPIDVLFVDKNNRVIKAIPRLAPFRFTYIYFNARLAIELPAGTIQTGLTQEGDALDFRDTHLPNRGTPL